MSDIPRLSISPIYLDEDRGGSFGDGQPGVAVDGLRPVNAHAFDDMPSSPPIIFATIILATSLLAAQACSRRVLVTPNVGSENPPDDAAVSELADAESTREAAGPSGAASIESLKRFLAPFGMRFPHSPEDGRLTAIVEAHLKDARPDVHRCRPFEQRCGDIPDSNPPVPAAEGPRWQSRAASLVLGHEARERATWSKASVVVASAVDFPLPRHHRPVSNEAAGDEVLKKCGQERLLLEVAVGEPRRGERDEIIVDVSLGAFGVECDRAERTIFQHGITFYRVIFGRSRPVVLLRSEIAF